MGGVLGGGGSNDGGSNDQTVANTDQKQKSNYKPYGRRTMQGVVNRAEDVSQTPYAAYDPNAMVAGMNPLQTGAVDMVGDAYANQSLPYMQNAAQIFQDTSQNITSNDIDRFYNPHADAVMANLQEIFGQQQRDASGKYQQMAGGVGADRAAVAEGELARQQGLAGGQTMAGIWQNAVNNLMGERGMQQASAYGLGSMSQMGLQNALGAASFNLGVGNIQQQTDQQLANAKYGEFMREQGYPFQTAQWYSNIALPAAGMQGGQSKGTASGTQTVDPADPNAWSQVAGLAMMGLGAMAKDGGRIKGYADGGSPMFGSYVPGAGGGFPSYVPGGGGAGSGMPSGAGAASQMPPTMAPLGFLQGTDQSKAFQDQMMSGLKAGQGASNLFGGSGPEFDPTSEAGWAANTTTSGPGWMSGLGSIFGFDQGGAVSPFGRLAQGGSPFGGGIPGDTNGDGVLDSDEMRVLNGIAMGKKAGGEVKGYAIGGAPYDPDSPWGLPMWGPGKDYEDRLNPEIGNNSATINSPGETAATKLPPPGETVVAKTSPFTPPPPQEEMAVAPATQPGELPVYGQGDIDPVEPVKPVNPLVANDTPPGPYTFPRDGTGKEATGPIEDGTMPPPVEGEAPAPDPYSPEGFNPVESPFGSGRWAKSMAGMPLYSRPKLFGKELDNMNIALMAAGAGMLGGNSPYFGVNVGQGALAGINALKEFQTLDANKQAQAMQRWLSAGNLDVSEQQLLSLDKNRAFTQANDLIREGWIKGDKAQVDFGKAILQKYGLPNYADSVGSDMPKAEIQYPEGADPTLAVNRDAIPDNVDSLSMQYGSQMGQKGAIKASDDILKDARTKADSAREVRGQLHQARHYLDQMPDSGLLVGGSLYNTRVEFAKAVNTMKRAFSDPKDQAEFDKIIKETERVGDAEALIKLQTYMGFTLARTLGTREAMQVIQQALNAVTGGQLTPAGAKNILYGVMSGADLDKDRYHFIDKWSRKSGYGSAVGADTYFDENVGPVSKYSDKRVDLYKKLDQARRLAKTPEDLEKLREIAKTEYMFDTEDLADVGL